MKRVAGRKAVSSSQAQKVDPGYRVPDPLLLIGAQSAEKRQRYIINWLAVRLNWVEQIDSDPLQKIPTMQMWRDLLNNHDSSSSELLAENTVSTKSSQVKSVVLHVFGPACTVFTLGGESPPRGVVQWHDEDIDFATLSDPPPRLIHAILWEVYELGFRFELLALDQALVPELWKKFLTTHRDSFDGIFPTPCGQPFWRAPLPKSAGSLGLMDRLTDNSDTLQRLCVFLAGWPDAPSSLNATAFGLSGDQLWLWEFEQASRVTMFYVETFYQHFGHAPLVPHQFPPEFF